MRREDEIRLDVISSISDEHIDPVTRDRIHRKREARVRLMWQRGLAAAASFVILLSVVLTAMVGLLDNGVPVYTGMTVSNDSPFAALDKGGEIGTASLAALKKPTDKELEGHFGIQDGTQTYYAYPEEDIYITVKLDNPNNFEILSFTLNGVKYSAYMFEDGSDMENLVLKVNVGDAPGLVSYTIDAIKYVDGEKIKDVRMSGERTVTVGIFNNSQPTSVISSPAVNDTSISVDAIVNDPCGLIKATGGRVYAILYDGEAVVGEIEVEVGKTTRVTFSELVAGKEYSVATVAVFDAYDGRGFAPHVIGEYCFSAGAVITATDITVSDGAVDFRLDYSNDGLTVQSIELISWGGDVIFTSTEAVTHIENITPGKLTLNIGYTDGSGGAPYQSSVVFWNAEGMMPVIGEIKVHYSETPVMNSYGTYYEHYGTDVKPTTDDIGVYAIADGMVKGICEPFYDDDGTLLREGMIEIQGADERYHIYRFVSDITVAGGDEVKVGDLLGVISDVAINHMSGGKYLHYECYRIEGGTLRYEMPSFDYPVLSDMERWERIMLANDVLVNGYSVSGTAGEVVTQVFELVTFESDEIVLMVPEDQAEGMTLTKLEKNKYELTCDFGVITDSASLYIRCRISFGTYQTNSWTTLTATLIESN